MEGELKQQCSGDLTLKFGLDWEESGLENKT